MSVSPDISTLAALGGWSAMLGLVALVAYAWAALPGVAEGRGWRSFNTLSAAFGGAWLLHGAALVADVSGIDTAAGTPRFGFAPALAGALWLIVAVHAVESRLLPLPAVRRAFAVAGVWVMAVLLLFPGDVALRAQTPWGPLHLLLGMASYGLFGAAVLHGLLLDSAERTLRRKGMPAASGLGPLADRPLPGGAAAFGLPLLRLERLTFRFVEAGFAVLSAALVVGVSASWLGHVAWRWDHKTVFSLLGWSTFALLIWGRHARGWRGRRATRWLYIGAGLLLLAYVGSRFVAEVLLQRSV